MRLRRVSTFVFGLTFTVVACKRPAPTAQSDASALATASVPTPTATASALPSNLKVCKTAFKDCPWAGGGRSDCSVDCRKAHVGAPDSEEGYCQTIKLTNKPGVGPCTGYRRDELRSNRWSYEEKQPVTYLCDVNAGVYCNDVSHTCAPVVPIGGACKGENACGREGNCDSKTNLCVPAVAIGKPCSNAERCVPAAYCDDKQVCAPRIPIGGKCKESEQCASFACQQVNGKAICDKPIVETPCPL